MAERTDEEGYHFDCDHCGAEYEYTRDWMGPFEEAAGVALHWCGGYDKSNPQASVIEDQAAFRETY